MGWTLSYHGAHLWNLLPNDMKKCKDLDIFKLVLGTGMNLCVNVVCVCSDCFLCPLINLTILLFV